MGVVRNEVGVMFIVMMVAYNYKLTTSGGLHAPQPAHQHAGAPSSAL